MDKDQREEIRRQHLNVGDVVCVAYSNQYGTFKETKVGLILNIDNDMVEVLVQSQYSTSTIKERIDSFRLMPIVAADKIAEDLREKANQTKDKLERKKRKNKDY